MDYGFQNTCLPSWDAVSCVRARTVSTGVPGGLWDSDPSILLQVVRVSSLSFPWEQALLCSSKRVCACLKPPQAPKVPACKVTVFPGPPLECPSSDDKPSMLLHAMLTRWGLMSLLANLHVCLFLKRCYVLARIYPKPWYTTGGRPSSTNSTMALSSSLYPSAPTEGLACAGQHIAGCRMGAPTTWMMGVCPKRSQLRFPSQAGTLSLYSIHCGLILENWKF